MFFSSLIECSWKSERSSYFARLHRSGSNLCIRTFDEWGPLSDEDFCEMLFPKIVSELRSQRSFVLCSVVIPTERVQLLKAELIVFTDFHFLNAQTIKRLFMYLFIIMRLFCVCRMKISVNTATHTHTHTSSLTDTHLEDHSADELHTLDDGVLAPWYRHLSLCGVGEEVTCHLHLGTCRLHTHTHTHTHTEQLFPTHLRTELSWAENTPSDTKKLQGSSAERECVSRKLWQELWAAGTFVVLFIIHKVTRRITS